jgi:hypothetical protein
MEKLAGTAQRGPGLSGRRSRALCAHAGTPHCRRHPHESGAPVPVRDALSTGYTSLTTICAAFTKASAG